MVESYQKLNEFPKLPSKYSCSSIYLVIFTVNGWHDMKDEVALSG